MSRFGQFFDRFRKGGDTQPPRRSPAVSAGRPKVGDVRPGSAPRPGGRRVAPPSAPVRSGHRVEADTELADVTIVYSPVLDGDPDPGEVVWTWVQFEDDPTQGKDRPVVIIGRTGSDLAAVQLTTKPHPERRDEVPVGVGSWDSSGRVSYAKLERILTVDPGGVRREGAILDKHRFDDVATALRKFHGIGLA